MLQSTLPQISIDVLFPSMFVHVRLAILSVPTSTTVGPMHEMYFETISHRGHATEQLF